MTRRIRWAPRSAPRCARSAKRSSSSGVFSLAGALLLRPPGHQHHRQGHCAVGSDRSASVHCHCSGGHVRRRHVAVRRDVLEVARVHHPLHRRRGGRRRAGGGQRAHRLGEAAGHRLRVGSDARRRRAARVRPLSAAAAVGPAAVGTARPNLGVASDAERHVHGVFVGRQRRGQRHRPHGGSRHDVALPGRAAGRRRHRGRHRYVGLPGDGDRRHPHYQSAPVHGVHRGAGGCAERTSVYDPGPAGLHDPLGGRALSSVWAWFSARKPSTPRTVRDIVLAWAATPAAAGVVAWVLYWILARIF